MSPVSLRDTIRNSQQKRKHFSWNGVEIYIKDNITSKDFTIKQVLEEISRAIPKKFLYNLDSIYVGDFEFLNKRQVQAVYENSSIFVTNNQDSIEDMADDIIHEIAHSVEETEKHFIYADGLMEREFISKRKKMYEVLQAEGYEVELMSFLEAGYSQSFDQFLHTEVGYPVLEVLTSNLFYSPYASTSLREYFANGFEAYYYYRDGHVLSKISPVLCDKIVNLIKEEEHEIRKNN